MVRLGKLGLIFLLTLSANASVFTFGEIILNSSGITSKIVKEGVSGASVTSLKNSVRTSVDSIMKGHSNLPEALKSIRKNVSSADQQQIDRVLYALEQPADRISGERFKTVVNDLVYIADSHSKFSDNYLSCSLCEADQLKSLGFSSSISKVAEPKLQKYLNRIPNGPEGITRYIKKNARKAKISDATRFLDKNDKKTLALFMSFGTNKNEKSYYDFYQAVLNFNKDSSGKVHLAGPKSKSSLWKVINGKFTPSKAKKLASAIDSASRAPASKREDALYDELFKLSDKTPGSKSKIEELKEKNCLFK